MDHLRYPSFRARPPAGAAPQGVFFFVQYTMERGLRQQKSVDFPFPVRYNRCACDGAGGGILCLPRFLFTFKVPDAMFPGGEES